MQEQLKLPEPPEEEWRPVVSWEGWYEVSSLGRVRRVKPYHSVPAGRLKNQHVGTHGYLSLMLKRPGFRQTRTVHSLVAEAFIGPRPSSKDVNHIDGNKLNPRAVNLEYMTRRENLHEAAINGLSNPHHATNRRRGPAAQQSTLTEEDVLFIRMQFKTYGVLSNLARQFNVTPAAIQAIRNRTTWKHI